jgi:hypothetical protein
VTGLVEFYLARLAEREQVARAASPGPWSPDADGYEVLAADGITVAEGFALSGPQLRATVQHIALNNPERVLADIAAKRALVDNHESALAWSQDPNCPDSQRETYRLIAGGLYDAIRHLSTAHSAHPDYDPSWAMS